MKTANAFRDTLITAGVIAATGLGTPAFAAAPSVPSAALTPVRQGDISYVTGGIGDGERNALRAEARDYNLQVSNANAEGQYTVDTNVTITSQNGRQMISVKDAGPLLFAKLAPGEYTIKAANDQQERVRHIKVEAQRPTNVHFIWHES